MDSRPLLAWLDNPDPTRGIRFARDGDDWDFWPYDSLADATLRLARGLRSLGVDRNDVVSVILPTGPEFVIALFGAMASGCVPSPVAPPMAFQDDDAYQQHITALLITSSPTVVVTDSTVLPSIADAIRAAGVSLVVTVEELTASAPDGDHRPAGADLALLQFTSGSSGAARGVRVPFVALEANVTAIREWLAMTRDDPTASWLPVHHDMGLIGCLVTPIVNRSDIWLMKPEQFVRRPQRYLRCFGEAGCRLTAMPNFGLAYIARRVRPASLDGLDFSGWRALIVGAERLDTNAFDRFDQLLRPHGFRASALLPAYGLAEATLAVTGLSLTKLWRSISLMPDSLFLGGRIRQAEATDPAQRVVGCGHALRGVTVSVVDGAGNELPDEHVGEIVVSGSSVAAGYTSGRASPSLTSLEAGTLKTGDVGFVVDGELFVLGRLGDAMKVRGRTVFAEDVEAALVAAGLPSQRLAAALGVHQGVPTVVAVLEQPSDQWRAVAERVVRTRTSGASIVIAPVGRGAIARTSSGKPKRRLLWDTFERGDLPVEQTSAFDLALGLDASIQ
jgi:acyl-CoA synthetase (AMP-forming)/AMP-acid ligase II